MLGSYSTVYDIPWPDSLLRLIEFANLFNIPVVNFPGLSCLYPGMGLYQATTLYFILPIMLVAYVAALHSVTPSLLRRLRGRKVHSCPTAPTGTLCLLTLPVV